MNVTLQRGKGTAHGTHGVLIGDGSFLCFTLEEPWRNNEPKISCIPEGVYKCKKHNGAKFSNVWEVLDVPGRSAILIHSGNTLADTEGCILVGLGTDAAGLTQSRAALMKLRSKLPDNFTLTIRNFSTQGE